MKSRYSTETVTSPEFIDLNRFYRHPGILAKEKGDLVIFNYSRECQYDRMWDEITLQCRGLICNRHTGEVISRPFSKFFNLNETPETTLTNLPDVPFTATVKLDGLLGISYTWDGKLRIATRGSFGSPWAIWATKWLNTPGNVRLELWNHQLTYLFEIISPQSQIVIDYEGKEALVLIGVRHIASGYELSYNEMIAEAEALGVEHTEMVEFKSISEMVQRAGEIPKDEEGWVVTYRNGLKLKIKGDEYKKIFKFMTYASPIAFWQAWEFQHLCNDPMSDPKNVGIPKEWLTQFAEEFREDTDKLAAAVDRLHWDLWDKVAELMDEIQAEVDSEDPNDDGRLYATKLKARKDIKRDVKRVVFFMKNKNWWKVWTLIHRAVRPTFNHIEGFEYEGLLKKFKDFGKRAMSAEG